MPRRTCFDDNISVGIRTFYTGNAEYQNVGGTVHRFVGVSYGGAYGTIPRRTCFDDNISVGIRTLYAGNAEYPITMGGIGLSVHHTVVHFGRCPVERVSMIIFLSEYVRYMPEMRNTKTSGGRGIGDAAPYGYGYGYGYGCGYGGWGGFGVSVI